MRPQPTCTVVRAFAEVAYGNFWWLMFEELGVLLSIGDIN